MFDAFNFIVPIISRISLAELQNRPVYCLSVSNKSVPIASSGFEEQADKTLNI